MYSQQNSQDLQRYLKSTVDSSVYSNGGTLGPTHAVEDEGRVSETPVNLEEFDLLAGHDFGSTQSISRSNKIEEAKQILFWQKLETSGFHPAAREV